jgi:HK97 family phage prohead protease
MPMTPHKDETQSEFMARCVPETIGTGADKRPQEQAVAICLDIWRNKDKAIKQSIQQPIKQDPLQPDDDETYQDFMDRCTDEADEDACQTAWEDRRAHGVIHKTHADEVNGMEFVLSDSSVDRMGDIIEADGWDLANFKRNPIALGFHRSDFPIGKWANLHVNKDKQLRGHLELAPKGTSPRIDELRALVGAGILKAVSVGFRPIEHAPINPKDPWSGSRFTKQELVECSLVSVPANANAMAVAKSLNVSPETLDLVFAGTGKKDGIIKRHGFTGGSASISRNGKGATMSLHQRIAEIQTYIGTKSAELEEHVAAQDDTNVSDEQYEKTKLLNDQLASARRQHAMLIEAEKNIAPGGTKPNGGNGSAHSRALATTAMGSTREAIAESVAAPIIIKSRKKDWDSVDLLVHAGTSLIAAKNWGVSLEAARTKIYGDDEPTKVVTDWVMRAPSAPAMTTVPGWAQELVHQIYADLMGLLFAKSIFPRLSAKGLTLAFGQAGKIVMPTRSRTPSLAGSFVGEGMAIPVRQGAFTSQTFTPKKLAVISVFTREMSEHSIPAIEGVLREAIAQDTAIAIDSVLIDINPATTIRPAGILNGVAALTATAGGGIPAIVGDLKQLVGALIANLYGNLRNPCWLMNPGDMLSASLATAVNTGIFPFMEQIQQGQLGNIPIIDSATVPSKTVVLIDASDFVTMQGDAVRMELSDTATLHMEDTNPLDLVSGSPGTVASPQRSLFQTDSIALRMIAPLNWAIRRPGTVAWTQNVTW